MPRLDFLKAQRRLWFRVHLYLGLTLGVFLSIIGVTGSLLVFWREIDELLNPALLRVPSANTAYRPLDEIAAAFPKNATLLELAWPRHPNAAFTGYFSTPRSSNTFNLFIDPYTARVTGSRLWFSAENWWRNPFTGILFKLHYALMLRTWGIPLVGILALFFLILTLAGLFLWWPLTGNWRQAFSLQWKTRLNFALHKATGLSSLAGLLLLLLTGLYLNLTDQVIWLVSRVASVDQPAVPTPHTAGPLTLGQAIALAERVFPGAQPDSLELSAAHTVEFHQRVALPFHLTSRRTITIDLATGQISHLADPARAPLGTAYLRWQWPLHSGLFWGWPSRILVFLSGLACPVLLLTGFNRWWWKRKAHQRQTPPPVTRNGTQTPVS